MSKSAEEIHKELGVRFPDKIKGADLEALDPFILVEADSIAEVATWLRDESEMAFDMLHCLSGVDYPKDEKMEVVYHLFSLRKRHSVVVKVELPRDGAVVPTVENVWKTANWHERETYDLYGIRFEGHSDLRRIFLPDDWEGHPLRKDWEWPDEWHGIPVKAGRSLAERAEEDEDIGVGPFD